MTDFTPDLPPDLASRAAAMRADRPHTRLSYCTDLVKGMTLLVEKPCENPMHGLLASPDGGGHRHGTEQRIIAEIRDEGDLVSAILVGEDGEQHPFYNHRLALVRVVDEIPGLEFG